MTLKVVVTGASGYIASLAIKDILAESKEYEIIAVVRDQSKQEKYEFLRQLPGAAGRLSFKYGDLENADYEEIFKGADYVIHAASPFIYTAADPQRDIIQPAIQGNLRVLNAASKTPSIKKVIITSSVAAIVDPVKKKEVYNEDDWNDSTNINVPYPYSKYLAEKAAWDFTEKNGKQHFQLIFINPALVFGPSVDAKNLSLSVQMIKTLLAGQSGPAHQRRLGVVDVRDVSSAILKVLKSSENYDHQRYAMSTDVITFDQVHDIIKELFPQYQIPDFKLDGTQPGSYKVTSKSPIKLDSLIDLKTSLKDTVNWLIENNHYTPINA